MPATSEVVGNYRCIFLVAFLHWDFHLFLSDDNVKTWKNRIPEKHFFLSGEFYRRHKLSRHLPKESTSWPFIINFTFYWYNNGFSLYWCSSLPHLRLPLPEKMYGQVSIVLYKNVIKTIKDFMAYRRLPEFLWNGLRDSRFATRNKKLREIPKKLRATRRHNCNTNDISEVRNNIHVFQFGQIESHWSKRAHAKLIYPLRPKYIVFERTFFTCIIGRSFVLVGHIW